MQDGTWMPGDIIAPDGWSSKKYPTLEKCEYHKDFLNSYLKSIGLNERAVGKCIDYDPRLPVTGV